MCKIMRKMCSFGPVFVLSYPAINLELWQFFSWYCLAASCSGESNGINIEALTHPIPLYFIEC